MKFGVLFYISGLRTNDSELINLQSEIKIEAG